MPFDDNGDDDVCQAVLLSMHFMSHARFMLGISNPIHNLSDFGQCNLLACVVLSPWLREVWGWAPCN